MVTMMSKAQWEMVAWTAVGRSAAGTDVSRCLPGAVVREAAAPSARAPGRPALRRRTR